MSIPRETAGREPAPPETASPENGGPLAADPGSAPSATPSHLPEWFPFLRRAVPWVLAGALLFGVVGALSVWLGTSTVYRAQTLVAIQAGRGDDAALGAVVLPAQGYLSLAESRPVLRRTREVLRRGGMKEAAKGLQSTDFDASLIRPDRWEASRVLILQMEAKADTPELAIQRVNGWAETFIELDDDMARATALEKVEDELDDSYDRVVERQVVVKEELEALLIQLAEVKPFVTLETVVSDRELLGRGGGGDTLVSQQSNPVYTQMMMKRADLEMELVRLGPQLQRILRDLELTQALQLQKEATKGDPSPAALAAPENDELMAGLGLKVKRALSARGASRILEEAIESTVAQSGSPVLRILVVMMGGAILGFLLAVGREVLRPPSQN